MSQSPEFEPDLVTVEADEPYLQALVKINDMINRGASLSGNERNSLFLNTGQEQFADVSAATGFDLPDDARAVAKVDWDNDGDLDLWITNRSGPRIRFLRNQINNRNQFLTIRLTGKTCNRNAIGARVELRLDHDRKLVRSLRAGEGFLGQSSKRLHFGLSSDDVIESMVVHWPDRSSQIVEKVVPNRHYTLLQGHSIVEWRPNQNETSAATMPHRAPKKRDHPTPIARVVLPEPITIPRLIYESADGSLSEAVRQTGPTVVQLWAGWCGPCLLEINEWNDRIAIFPENLRILALNVEKLDPSTRESADESMKKMVKKLAPPFELGFATHDLITKLQVIHDSLLRHDPLPLPASLLLDSDGRLAAIYKGPVSARNLSEDIRGLTERLPASRLAFAPFSGRWIGSKPTFRPADLMRNLIAEGLIQSANDYGKQMRPSLENDSDYATLLIKMGNAFLQKKQFDDAETTYREALERQPDLAIAYFDLGLTNEFQGRIDEAIDQYKKAIELNPNQAQALLNLGVLIARHRDPRQGLRYVERAIDARSEVAVLHYHRGLILQKMQHHQAALASFRKSHELDPSHVATWFPLARYLEKTEERDVAARLFRQLTKAWPASPAPRTHLGVLLEADDPTTAIRLYREALSLDSNHLAAANNLAWLLATLPDPSLRNAADAIRLGEFVAAKTRRANPAILDTLAAAYASDGQFEKAIDTLDVALQIAEQQKQFDLANQLRQRLKLYQKGTPFVQEPR